MDQTTKEQLDHSQTETDGETEQLQVERLYDETFDYLMHGRYPEGASKQDTTTAWG